MKHPKGIPEQAMRHRDYQTSSPSNVVMNAKSGFCHDDYEEHEYTDRNVESNNIMPYSGSIELNWKWSYGGDTAVPAFSDVSGRSVVVKERSVFVGCIPDGVEDISEVLQNLMEAFLERFDFAPVDLSQVLVVKVLKDFAFLELSSEKVAQIVLAANQLDVFEWGINGCHFNIEGCKGTHTSVRPLIEYMPLKPARVIFVGNIPKSHWQRDYLEEVFSRILWGSDGQTDVKPVLTVYLLPESSDAYLELASEYIADALIYKCTKNNQLMKEIGEDVFICRDVNSPPMMSRHKVEICPQRSLFIGISVRDEYFKIDCIRKVFDDILPLISRTINCYAYVEYICIQPGKDYAFFQFNSEMVVDAIMDEYIENTQIFVCKHAPAPLTYIILRPPEYVRPGARYNSAEINRRHSGGSDSQFRSRQGGFNPNAGRSHAPRNNQARMKMLVGEQSSSLSQVSHKYGDEPIKKPDFVMSIGASPIPVAIWNGPGASSADPDSLVVIEGLPKGFSYKLLRGALNELFERALSHTGLLEVGMLVLGYLDRDEDFDVVACLPSADFAYALLSLQNSFIVCGHEVRLLPKENMRNVNGRSKPPGMLWGQEEMSASSDEEARYGRGSYGGGPEEWKNPILLRQRKRGFPENVNGYDMARRPNLRRKFELYQDQTIVKEDFHNYQRDRNFNGYQNSRTDDGSYWEDTKPKAHASHGFKGASFPKYNNRAMMQGRGTGRGLKMGSRRFN